MPVLLSSAGADDDWLNSFFSMGADHGYAFVTNSKEVDTQLVGYYGSYVALGGTEVDQFAASGVTSNDYMNGSVDKFGFSPSPALNGPEIDTSNHYIIDGGGGNDHLYGRSGDLLYGNSGDDYLLGGKYLIGGDGNDHMSTWIAGALYWGGKGDDTITMHTQFSSQIFKPQQYVMVEFNSSNAGDTWHDTITNFGPQDTIIFNDHSHSVSSAADLDKLVTVTGTVDHFNIEWKDHSGGIHVDASGGLINGKYVEAPPDYNAFSVQQLVTLYGSQFADFSHSQEFGHGGHWWF